VALDKHRIDHSDPARVIISTIHETKRIGFVRDGAIDSDETVPGQQLEGLLQFLRPNLDPGIARLDPALFQRRIVHRRRSRMRHGIAKHRQPDRRLLAGCAGRPVPQIFDRVKLLHAPETIEIARANRASTRSLPSTSSM
jgi:hypothetical protein